MRVPLIPVLALIALTLVGCGREKSGEGATPTPSPTAEAAAPVTVAVARQGFLDETATMTGHLRALSKAQVHSRVGGRVVSVNVREGDRVAAGEVLVVLEATALQAQERQAAANLQAAQARLQQARAGRGLTDVSSDLEIQRVQQGVYQAEANTARARAEHEDAIHNLQRQRSLFEQSAVSKYAVEQAELREKVSAEQLESALSGEKAAREAVRIAQANRQQVGIRESEVEAAAAAVEQARAALEAVRVDLLDTVLRSPIAGTVVKRAVEPGQALGTNSSTLLLLVVDNSTLDMVAPLDERHRAAVRRHSSVQVKTAVGGTVTGQVVDVIPASDPATHTITVRVQVPNAQGNLVEGAYASADLVLRRVDGIVVSRQALHRKGEGVTLVLAEGGKARRVPVKVVFQTDLQAVVTGLDPGANVVVTGGENLEDGRLLEIRQEESKG